MKVFWLNDALCLRPENEVERKALVAVLLNSESTDDNQPSFTGEQPESQVVGSGR